MTKINFTKEHFMRLQHLTVAALFNNTTFKTSTGQVLNIVELLHTTTINTLTAMKVALTKKITQLEEADEWVKDTKDQRALEEAQVHKELINLIIGYKRLVLERESNEAKRRKLSEELKALKDSQKTPEDRIKEKEAELAALNSEDFN